MENNEAPIVMFTNYKRADGFEVSLTMRGNDLRTVATALDEAIKVIASKGGTPVTRQKAGGFPPKQVEYVEGRKCPTCGARLVRVDTKKGKAIKCETSKYDFTTKTSTGCPYFEWDNGVPRVNTPTNTADADFDY